jgi:hypothetical protein
MAVRHREAKIALVAVVRPRMGMVCCEAR